MPDFNDLSKEQGFEAVEDAVNNAVYISETKEETLIRLSLLPYFEYDQIRKEEAEKLGVRVSVLDLEVSKLRPREPKNNTNAIFQDIEPWDQPIDMAVLLDEIARTIRRFIVCDEETVIAASLWVAFSWIIDYVQIAPIALITAPEMQCGKTQLLNLIGKMVYRPLVSSNISPASIYRIIEEHKPTLLIDEADSFLRENEEARGIINSGHTRDAAYVVRVVGDDHEAKQFSTWGAKVICGIGKQAATIMDRSIILELRRKLPHEKVERLRHINSDDFLIIKKKLARFSKDAGSIIETSRPTLPEDLSDRDQDNWEPLLAIAYYAGGYWPFAAYATAIKLWHKKQEEVSTSVGNMLLVDIQSILQNEVDQDRIATRDILIKLHELEDRPWSEWNKGKPISAAQISKHLKPFGIKSKKIRFGVSTFWGYETDQFKDAFDRYLSRTPEQQNNNNRLDTETNGTSVSSVPPQSGTNLL